MRVIACLVFLKMLNDLLKYMYQVYIHTCMYLKLHVYYLSICNNVLVITGFIIIHVQYM